MGSAAAIHVPAFDEKCMPKHGVRLSYIYEFFDACGGKDALKGLSTTDVCENFIKPWTASHKCALNDLLRETNHPSYHPNATVFISHAWKYTFLDVADCLLHHFADNPDIVIWFDLFSNNQHKAAALQFDWWATTFRTAIEEFGYTLMVLMPWDDPIPLKRAWCLWELFCSHDTACKFEVAMGPRGYQAFIEALDATAAEDSQISAGDIMNRMLSHINVQKSEAFKKEDQAIILSTVQSKVPGGFNKLNGVVMALMRNWVVSVAQSELEKRKAASTVSSEYFNALMSLGNLHAALGKYEQAVALYSECLSIRTTLLGDNHPLTLVAMANLGRVYSNQGKYAEAEKWIVDCLEKRKTILGDLHPATLTSMDSLATLYFWKGHYTQAEALYSDCLDKRRATLGDSHVDTLASTSGLATVYKNQRKLAEAESLYRDCLSMRRVLIGDTHPDTISASLDVAAVYSLQKKFSLAEPLFRDGLAKLKAAMGENHVRTLNCLRSMARMCTAQRKFSDAEQLFMEFLDKSSGVLGESHPTTLLAMNDLADLYDDQNKFNQSVPLYLDCVEKLTRTLGDSHPSTLSAINNLAVTYSKQGKEILKQSKHLFLQVLEKRRATLGDNHPDTEAARENYRLMKNA